MQTLHLITGLILSMALVVFGEAGTKKAPPKAPEAPVEQQDSPLQKWMRTAVEGAVCTTNEGRLAAITQDDLSLANKLVASHDDEALRKLMAANRPRETEPVIRRHFVF